eukprot:scaffold1344_cov388-Prasinococcus_capsulatus_cf.AAC.1
MRDPVGEASSERSTPGADRLNTLRSSASAAVHAKLKGAYVRQNVANKIFMAKQTEEPCSMPKLCASRSRWGQTCPLPCLRRSKHQRCRHDINFRAPETSLTHAYRPGVFMHVLPGSERLWPPFR